MRDGREARTARQPLELSQWWLCVRRGGPAMGGVKEVVVGSGTTVGL